MVTVTPIATKRFEELLKEQEAEPGYVIRLTGPTTNPSDMKLLLDRERVGDQLVKTEAGDAVLAIGPEVAANWHGRVIDFENTPENKGFTISPPQTGT